MFGKVVHEFRQPINAIQSSTCILELNINSLKAIFNSMGLKQGHMSREIDNIWESCAKFLKTSQISTRMMTNLTDDILDLSKINAGVFELIEKPFPVSDLVEEVSYIFEVQCEQKGIGFEFTCSEELKTTLFCSDINRIKQILLNFISNAFKFTSVGSITVTVELEEG